MRRFRSLSVFWRVLLIDAAVFAANILEKLGMRDRVDLTRYAIRRGLIEP